MTTPGAVAAAHSQRCAQTRCATLQVALVGLLVGKPSLLHSRQQAAAPQGLAPVIWQPSCRCSESLCPQPAWSATGCAERCCGSCCANSRVQSPPHHGVCPQAPGPAGQAGRGAGGLQRDAAGGVASCQTRRSSCRLQAPPPSHQVHHQPTLALARPSFTPSRGAGSSRSYTIYRSCLALL